MCTAELRGGGFHTKPSVSASDFFHTSLNTLFTAYSFAPRAPGAPQVLTDVPLCRRSGLHHSGVGRPKTDLLHPLWCSRHNNVLLLTHISTYDITAWFSHITICSHTKSDRKHTNIKPLMLKRTHKQERMQLNTWFCIDGHYKSKQAVR